MIFKTPIQNLSKTEKKFFREKIDIYIRLVEVFCEKNNINYSDYKINEIYDFDKEYRKIGVLSLDEYKNDLKVFLGPSYYCFKKAVSFAIENKEEINHLLYNLNNYERFLKQKEFYLNNKPTVVDFFCGAGGLSLGFKQEDFKIKLAVDIEDVCIETYTYNHPELPSKYIIKEDIKNIIGDVDKYIKGDIDVVIGGPPCQGFSEANRQRIIDDPRNKLYKYFVKAVEKISPKYVVMENVKGMLKVANQVVEDYKNIKTVVNGVEIGYIADYKILNSVNFSVAQNRERLIYIAIREDIVKNKAVTPEMIFEKIIKDCENKSHFNLEDALKDIKILDSNFVKNTNELDINYFENEKNKYLNLINMGESIPYIFNHKARYCSPLNYEIYGKLNQGDNATDEKIMDIMPYAHRNHCFKDKYFKLIADKPCRTITAHMRMDCHSHIHPYQIRSITPREAARIQSFPDSYLFLGPYLKTYMQIGNAVPPMMSRGIAHIIKQYL